MAAIGADILVPCHCTGWKAIHELARRMPEAYIHHPSAAAEAQAKLPEVQGFGGDALVHGDLQGIQRNDPQSGDVAVT
jgi:hypothetical protein